MRTRDVSRQKKVYPTSRRKSQKRLMTNFAVKLEVSVLPFVAQTTRTLTFDEPYENAPNVTLAVGPVNAAQPTVNAFITAITNKTVTIETSGPFTGDIYVHVMEVNS